MLAYALIGTVTGTRICTIDFLASPQVLVGAILGELECLGLTNQVISLSVISRTLGHTVARCT